MLVALIGYGYWGKILEKYIDDNDFFKKKKVYDCNFKGVSNIKTNNLMDILEDEEIEAVFLATPIDTHFDLSKKFLNKEKHIFCEKPLVKTLAKAVELKEISFKKNKVLETNYTYLDSLSIKLMKKKIIEIGEIEYIEGEISQFGNFYKNDDVFSIIGCHFLSVIYYLLEIKENKILVDTKLKDLKGNILAGDVILKFDSFDVHFKFNLKSITKKRRLTIYGKKGIINFDMLNGNSLEIIMLNENIITNTESYCFDEKNNLIESLKRFENVIKGKKRTNLDISLNTTRILEEIQNVISKNG